MAKDTEKLIRQLSLISYLMAERRPVTALEIRRDVEGYSGMNEDAFARRFYADRAELESLGIQLTVDRPADGVAEQENYSLRPENFHLPAIAFTDDELRRAADRAVAARRRVRLRRAAAPRAAADHLGPPEPAARARRSSRSALGITASAGGARALASAWRRSRRRSSATRRSPSTTTRWSATRPAPRKVDPYHLLFQGGQFYLVGHSHERDALRVFRLSRIRGKVAYATKAEHDFQRPRGLRPARLRRTASRGSSATRSGPPRSGSPSASPGRSSATSAASARSPRRTTARVPHRRTRTRASSISWVLGLRRARARRSARPSWSTRSRERVDAARRARTRGEPARRVADGAARRRPTADAERRASARAGEAAIRPERFARLVTLASILIEAGRAGPPARGRRGLRAAADLRRRSCARTSTVLNVVNFGGGSYVLYAEVRRRRDRGRPRALLRQLRPPGAAAADRGQGAGRGDRPDRRPPPERRARLARARRSSRRSARTRSRRACRSRRRRRRLEIARVGRAGDRTSSRLLELEYYKPERGRVLRARASSRTR